MHPDKEYVIFSSSGTHMLHNHLTVVTSFCKPKVVIGAYKGQQEVSFCVESDEFFDKQQYLRIKDQESILHIGPPLGTLQWRRCHLIYKDRAEYVGEWAPVDPANLSRVLLSGNYTYFPDNRQYFVTEVE